MTILTHYEPLRIGHSGDEPWAAMHRSGQRVVMFNIAFRELQAPPADRDYRLCLERLWAPFFCSAGLAANIGHGSWHVEKGPDRRVTGWVWRHQARGRLGTVTEEELFQLGELLLGSGSNVTSFILTEQITTGHFGNPRNQRKLSLRKGKFEVEPAEE